MPQNKQHTNPLIPKLRFPEFGNVWAKSKLKDVSKYFNGGSFEGDVLESGRYELITLKSIDVLGNLVASNRFIDVEVETLPKESLVMILSEQAPGLLGKTAIIPLDNKYVLNQRVAEIRPNHKVNSYFLSMAINRNQQYFSKMGAGMKVQNISKPNVQNYKFFHPSIQEQQKIASFLTAVDKKLTQLQEKKTLLVQYKKGVMQQLFSQELRFKPTGVTARTEPVTRNKVKAVSPNEHPDWEEKRLGEIFYSEKGNGISKGELNTNGKFNCILYGELYTKYNEVVFEVVSKTNSKNGLYSKKGDLLIPSSTTTTGIDLANVTALNYENIKLGGDIIVLRSNQEINNVYYAYYLSNHKKYQIASRAQGITIVHLYFSSIKDILIDMPSLEEQTQIANFLSAIDTKIELVTTQLENTQQFKKGLLQQLFV